MRFSQKQAAGYRWVLYHWKKQYLVGKWYAVRYTIKGGSPVKEEDLYPAVKRFFEGAGYEVKSEINGCDLVGVRGEECVICEMKLRLNLDVIVQAALRQKLTPYVYVCVPQLKRGQGGRRWSDIAYLLERLSLGLLTVRGDGEEAVVTEVFGPGDPGQRTDRRRRKKLTEEFLLRHGDPNCGGQAGRGLMTAYRENAVHIAGLLCEHGASSPKQLAAMGACKNVGSVLYQNYYGWFRHVSKGIYDLSELGEKAAQQYAELIAVLMRERSLKKI